MKDQSRKSKNVSRPKWLLPLAFVVISFIGFFSSAFVTGSYLDALSIPVIISFIWLGVYKQKIALAASLVSVFIVIAIPAMVAGLMRFSTITTILIPIIITTLSLGMYRTTLRKAIGIFIFFALSILLLYAFDYLDSDKFVVLMVGGGGALLGGLLFSEKPSISS